MQGLLVLVQPVVLLHYMADDIIYRKATADDLLQVSILLQIVYMQTYGEDGVTKEYANYVHRRFSVEYLYSALKANPNSILVATYKGNVVAAAEIKFESVCSVNGFTAPELSKLYILEWFCGKGIGYNLLKEVEKTVVAAGQSKIWLWVYTLNPRAIKFYERQGYHIIGSAIYQMEENAYVNYAMEKSL